MDLLAWRLFVLIFLAAAAERWLSHHHDCCDEDPLTPEVLETALLSEPSARFTASHGVLLLEVAAFAVEATTQDCHPHASYLFFRVKSNGTEVVTWSRLGLEVDETRVDRFLHLTHSTTQGSSQYTLASGKRQHVSVAFTELVMHGISCGLGLEVDLHFRLQHDGLAFHYTLSVPHEAPTIPQRLTQEYTTFRFPSNSTVWAQPRAQASKISPAEESFVRRVPVGSLSGGPIPRAFQNLFNVFIEWTGYSLHGSCGWTYPVLVHLHLFQPHQQQQHQQQQQLYAVISEALPPTQITALTHLAAVAELNGYRVALPSPAEGNEWETSQPNLTWPFVSPRRVLVVGSLHTVIESTLVTDVAVEEDTVCSGVSPSWVKPGRVAWTWWSKLDTGDEARQKAFIEFAGELGWEYVLIDANWNKWNGSQPEPVLRRLVTFAEERGVQLMLWYNSGGRHNRIMEEPRNRMHVRERRRKEFGWLRALGIRGVKVDFWHSDKPARVRHYFELLEDAFEFELLVNFHGCTVPRGWRRCHPHLLAMEAVKGAEWYQFPVLRGPSALDHVRYVFTRNTIGPMDYTPLVCAAALAQQGLPYVHSLALTVLFESGLQHFADAADARVPNEGYPALLRRFPALRVLLQALPVHWSATRFVCGHPDSHVVLGRRSVHGVWFFAGISALDEPISVDVPLPDCEGSQAWLVSQGDKPDDLLFSDELTDVLTVEMRPRGGFAAIVDPAGEFEGFADILQEFELP